MQGVEIFAYPQDIEAWEPDRWHISITDSALDHLVGGSQYLFYWTLWFSGV